MYIGVLFDIPFVDEITCNKEIVNKEHIIVISLEGALVELLKVKEEMAEDRKV